MVDKANVESGKHMMETRNTSFSNMVLSLEPCKVTYTGSLSGDTNHLLKIVTDPKYCFCTKP